MIWTKLTREVARLTTTNKMNKKTKFLFVAATLFLATACSQESDAIRRETLMAEVDQVESEFEAFIEEYKDVDPDFDVKCEYSGIVNRVRGHKDSPVLYWEYDSAEVHIEGYRYYSDDTPMELKKVSDDAIEIHLGRDVYRMEEIVQDGSTLSFKMNVDGMEAGFYSVESPYFEMGNVMNLLDINTKVPVGPIVRAVLKYVVGPFLVGVAASSAANSCSSSNNDDTGAKDCREKFENMAMDCQSGGGQPIIKHSDKCPKGCFYTCKQ